MSEKLMVTVGSGDMEYNIKTMSLKNILRRKSNVEELIKRLSNDDELKKWIPTYQNELEEIDKELKLRSD